MYWSGAFLIGKRINVNFVCDHKGRVETKSKVTDHLIRVGFVFVFFQEFGSAGECDLCDIFFYFIGCHTDTIIDEF